MTEHNQTTATLFIVLIVEMLFLIAFLHVTCALRHWMRCRRARRVSYLKTVAALRWERARCERLAREEALPVKPQCERQLFLLASSGQAPRETAFARNWN